MANARSSSGQREKRPNEDADGTNRPSTKLKTEASHSQLTLQSVRSDELDHRKLDEDTTAYLQEISDGVPERIYADLILNAVAETCHRLDSKLRGPLGAKRKLSQYGTVLKDFIMKAHVDKDYRAIRNLRVLQQKRDLPKNVSLSPHDKDQQKQAVELAWKIKYAGKAHILLHETVSNMTRSMGGRSYANSLAIVQSSGTGKSRTVHELGKMVFTIPFNLRADQDQVGYAYPFPDREIRNYLCDAPKMLEEARLYFMQFLYNLFSAVLKEVKKLESSFKQAKTYGHVAERWSTYLEKGGRHDLYRKVANMKYQRNEEAFLDFEMNYKQTQMDTVPDEANPGDDEDADDVEKNEPIVDLAEFKFVAQQTEGKIFELISYVDKFAKDDRCTSLDARVVIYFDEAHDLTNICVPSNRGSMCRTLYHAFCSAANGILSKPVFFLFLSTHSSLSQFAPPQWSYPSARTAVSEDTIQPPFTELPFDCSQAEPLIRPGQKKLEDVANIRFMSEFGRPLFYSLTKVPQEGVERRIVNLARAKLVGSNNPDTAEMTDDAKLAVLAVRVLLNFNTSRAKTQAQMVKLVQSHMAIAFSIPEHRETIRTGYPSEPILAEAAARQMYVMSNKTDVASPSRLLQKFTDSGVVDKGERGEAVARLIFTLAYDKAVATHQKENMINGVDHRPAGCPFYSRGVPLKHYIRALFGEEHAEHIFKSHPDNVKNGRTFEEAFDKAWVRFTHFQRAGDSSVISTEAAWAAAARAMAFQCSSGQAFLDMYIPIILWDAELREEIMSGILIQIKDRVRAGTKASVEIDERAIHFFPAQSGPKKDRRPYITIVMELGVQPFYQTQAKYEAKSSPTEVARPRTPTRASSAGERSTVNVVEGTPSILRISHMGKRSNRNTAKGKNIAKVVHPRYAIFVNGCSPSVYGVVDSKDVYAALLSSRHILQEHPRQTKDALSAVRRLKPFWIKGPECFDWTGQPKLSGMIPVEEPVAEGVTTGEDQLELGSVSEEEEGEEEEGSEEEEGEEEEGEEDEEENPFILK